METPSFNTLEITVDDGIATIYLNRPDRMNAFTREMKDELLAAFDSVSYTHLTLPTNREV